MANEGFQKPQSVLYTFRQERFDKTGELVDSSGHVIFRLVDEGDDHTISNFYKDYPLHIRRPNGSEVARIEWNGDSTKTDVIWYPNRKQKISGHLLDEDCKFTLPNGFKYEWEGVAWGSPFKLFDYGTPQPSSLIPAIAAIYNPRTEKTYMTIEVLATACSVPWLLEYLVVTVIWLEYMVRLAARKQETQEALKQLGEAVKTLGDATQAYTN